MLKRLLRKHGRQRSSELATALDAIAHGDLVRVVVELFAAGELRLHSPKRKRPLCAQFYLYDKANSPVGGWLLNKARDLKFVQHRERYGIRALLENVRWDIQLRVIKADDGFKICNDYQACYARQVMMRDPRLCGLFELNPSAADALVVDGRSWSDFAKEHKAELWPERANKKAAAA